MYHKHLKKVPVWMEEQQKSEIPEKENAYKFELFMQNCMGYIEKEKFGLLVVDREDEFAPVKNAPGTETDNPDTARQLLTNLHLKWFSLAGGQFDGEGDFEIDNMVTYGGEGLEEFVKESEPLKLPGYLQAEEKKEGEGEAKKD